jgi:hypothetical protein
MKSDIRELNAGELDAVSGGFKWNRNTENPDVIDARGGQISIFGYSVTFDYSGKVSSVTPPK